MHSEEITEHGSPLCSIVNIQDARGYKKVQVENWLRNKMASDYGENKAELLDNPPLRIITKLRGLSEQAQLELVRYARETTNTENSRNLSDQMWQIMRNCSRVEGSMENIEEFANTLLLKEQVYMKGMEA